MALATLAYVSSAVPGLGLKELKQILRRSRENNFRSEISGYLVFDGEHFLQLLEGETEVLDDLYLRIARDGRHQALRLLFHDRIDQRAFGEFCMGCTNLAAAARVDVAAMRAAAHALAEQRDFRAADEAQSAFRRFTRFRTAENSMLLTL